MHNAFLPLIRYGGHIIAPLFCLGGKWLTRRLHMEGSSRRRSSTPTIVLFVMVGVLVIVGLFLPPVSLGKRLFKSDYVRMNADTTQISHPDGLVLIADAGSLEDSVSIKLDTVPRADFIPDKVPDGWRDAVAGLPSYLSIKSPFYIIESKGEVSIPVRLEIDIPNDSEPYNLLDIYAWEGGAWVWLSSSIDTATHKITAKFPILPDGVAVFQAGAQPFMVGLRSAPGEAFPAEASGIVSELYPSGLFLGPAGVLMGEVATFGQEATGLAQFPTSEASDSSLMDALFNDPTTRQDHVLALTNLVVNGGYSGLCLNFSGVTAAQKAAFTGFVGEMATQLHSAGLVLVVTVQSPVQVAPGSWDTAGYDWPALSTAADRIVLDMTLDPTAYTQDGPVDQMLDWAVGQVNRYQLYTGIYAGGVKGINGVYSVDDSTDTLSLFAGSLKRADGEGEAMPGSQVVVNIPDNLINSNAASDGYSLSLEQDGQLTTIWLSNGATLDQKMRVLERYHLGGALIQGIAGSENANELVSAINVFLASSAAKSAATPVLTWSVLDESGNVVSEQLGDLNAPEFVWQAADAPGTYSINGRISIGQQVIDLGNVQVAVQQEQTPEPTKTPEPTATPETEVAEASATVTPGPAPDSGAVINGDLVNVRQGPGTYFSIVGHLAGGTRVQIEAVNTDKTWLKITATDGTAGWVLAELCDLYESLTDKPVEEVATPTPAPTSEAQPTTAPVAVVVPPSSGGSFELGGHIRTWNYLSQMASAGMNWVKVQVHYGEDASGYVATAHGNGFKIQLSALGSKDMIGKSNFHSDYGSWVASMAAAGADAIEVWNEPNIDAEWPLGQISPSAYTQLLCASYNAIKSANSGTAVISAAPAPTGYFGGCSGNGCDDLPWLQGMYNAGAASCMDYIGAHHNSGATSPSASSGHPADGGGGHHSWYFLPQTQLYFNTFGGARKLFYTEMGYASQEGVPTFSDWFAWARGIDNAEQAAWLAEAVTLSRTTGMVRCIIVWNIDFARYGNDPQDGYAIIRPDGSCPACSSLRSAMGY